MSQSVKIYGLIFLGAPRSGAALNGLPPGGAAPPQIAAAAKSKQRP